ncbi:nudix hydrolase 17, mitochondrial-like [Curcuma longa]|uniref:nudix hydrolase 17, mitochondrial-like n=1 Tax=Curcuma longa TaxID=136217 RepID=UPI003D9DF7ED
MMSPMASRQGRQLQRYSKSGRRLVVGCIPYKFDLSDDEPSVQVLIITSSKGNGFMLPKGGWETDETIKQAVSREAMEEAGVRGTIEGRIGTWVYKSRTYEAHYQAIMFPMKITEELAQWPEMHQRQRAWVSIAEAKERCQHWWMKEALDRMVKTIQVHQSGNELIN